MICTYLQQMLKNCYFKWIFPRSCAFNLVLYLAYERLKYEAYICWLVLCGSLAAIHPTLLSTCFSGVYHFFFFPGSEKGSRERSQVGVSRGRGDRRRKSLGVTSRHRSPIHRLRGEPGLLHYGPLVFTIGLPITHLCPISRVSYHSDCRIFRSAFPSFSLSPSA